MTQDDARKLTREALFECRKQAIRLHREGMTRVRIATIVGVHRNTVGQWIAKWEGKASKVTMPGRAGRPHGSGRTLTKEQERAVKRVIMQDMPEQLKLDFALWTRDAVRLLIREFHDIDMPIRTVGEYLKRWGFTPQKPVRRAYERSPKAVQQWLDHTYPAIHARSRLENAEIHWGDETGLRSDDVTGRGYSLRGKTPVRECKGTPEKVNMISTVTNLGKVRFMFYQGGFNADLLIDFMKRLLKDTGRKVFLILDNLRVHHARKVREWLDLNEERIEVFYLPSYSPNLNPDEYLNNDLKSRVSRKPDSRRKGQLKKSALSAMRCIQKQPEKVPNYFLAEEIRYAA